jgi:hypothetical protein
MRLRLAVSGVQLRQEEQLVGGWRLVVWGGEKFCQGYGFKNRNPDHLQDLSVFT